MDKLDTLQIYQSAFAKMDALTYLLDKNASLITCNQNLLRFMGCKQNGEPSIYKLLQQNGLWTSQQILNFQQSDLDAIITGQRQSQDFTLISGNGTLLFFEITRIPLLDSSGTIMGLMVVLRDTTKEKQLDEQQKDMKTKLRHANKILGHTTTEKTTNNKPVKVLLIEDNPLTQKIETHILTSCRCQTDAVATPEEVDEIFKPGKYDLVLMDIGLEKGNGYQVTAVLRKMEFGSPFRVPIIALTVSSPTEVGCDCDDAEMDGILQKPLTPEQAKQLIQRYIHHADVSVKGLKIFRH
jgi:CheY-like chemotaxis protein